MNAKKNTRNEVTFIYSKKIYMRLMKELRTRFLSVFTDHSTHT